MSPLTRRTSSKREKISKRTSKDLRKKSKSSRKKKRSKGSRYLKYLRDFISIIMPIIVSMITIYELFLKHKTIDQEIKRLALNKKELEKLQKDLENENTVNTTPDRKKEANGKIIEALKIILPQMDNVLNLGKNRS